MELNFINLPSEIHRKFFCDSVFTVEDIGTCLKVCKLFHQIINYSICEKWELLARQLCPQQNWSKVLNPSFNWKNWVITYKTGENKVLDTISFYNTDFVVKEFLKNIQYPLLQPYLHSDNSESKCRIDEALHFGADLGVAEDQSNNSLGKSCLKVGNVFKKKTTELFQNRKPINSSSEQKILDVISFYDKDVILKDFLKDTQYKLLEPFLNSNHPETEFRIGEALILARGIKRNSLEEIQQGIKHLRNSAEKKHPEALFFLCTLYNSSSGGLRSELDMDLAKSFEYYQLAADQGHVDAQSRLGFCYFEGIGCTKDLGKAFEYFQLAANQGLADAQSKLGSCYASGMGCAMDLDKAFESFQMAANQGFAEAQYKLGLCYESGVGCNKDLGKAFEYYQLAANRELTNAQFYLAICYENGMGCAKDLGKAFEYFKLAANQGDAPAQNILGLCYENGIGCTKDLGIAFESFQLAANQGLAQAQYNLGICYFLGRGCAKDLGKSFESYQLAANQGFAQAQYNLSVFYKDGMGCAKDLGKAFEYCQLAANQGHALAQNILGLCYENGIGCTKDLGTAFESFLLAANQGFAEAQYNLGVCYENGMACAKDLGKAFEYFQLAANQGYALAKNKLSL